MSSLDHTANSNWLSILHMVKYVGETVLNEPTTHISDSFAPLLGDVEDSTFIMLFFKSLASLLEASVTSGHRNFNSNVKAERFLSQVRWVVIN